MNKFKQVPMDRDSRTTVCPVCGHVNNHIATANNCGHLAKLTATGVAYYLLNGEPSASLEGENKGGQETSTQENIMAKLKTKVKKLGGKPRGGLAAAARARKEQEAGGDNGTPTKAELKAQKKADKAAAKQAAKDQKAADKLAKQQAKTTAKSGGGRMEKIFDCSVCAVVRKLGSEGVTIGHATAILAARNITMPPASLSVQLGYGRNGKRPAADLTAAQVKELINSAQDPANEQATATA